MNAPCIDPTDHLQYDWPRDVTGLAWCPFDSPILEPTWQEEPPEPEPPVVDNTLPGPQPEPTPHEGGTPIYWDHGPDVVTSFDDFERVAQEYSIYGEPGEARAYTEDENARADAIAAVPVIAQAQADLDRAVQVNAAPEELQALQEATLAGEGIESGDPWRQPTGAHDAYPLGAIVTHVDKTWESLVAANVWEPPTQWREVTAGGCPEWVQPGGSTDAYNTGDCVTFEGACYESTMDANVWSPTALPSGWTAIDCP